MAGEWGSFRGTRMEHRAHWGRLHGGAFWTKPPVLSLGTPEQERTLKATHPTAHYFTNENIPLGTRAPCGKEEARIWLTPASQSPCHLPHLDAPFTIPRDKNAVVFVSGHGTHDHVSEASGVHAELPQQASVPIDGPGVDVAVNAAAQQGSRQRQARPALQEDYLRKRGGPAQLVAATWCWGARLASHHVSASVLVHRTKCGQQGSMRKN